MDLNIFHQILILVGNIVAAFGVIIIAIGSLTAVYEFILHLKNFRSIEINLIRFYFGQNIVLGLELLVGADIIKSAAQPDYYNLGILAVLVIVRTILSYFLNQELIQLSVSQTIHK